MLMKYGYKEKPAPDFDYYSKNYRQYEEIFLKYSTMVEPPVFLNDDILHCMRSSGKNYFILNASNCNILRNIRFNFKLEDNIYKFTGITILPLMRL